VRWQADAHIGRMPENPRAQLWAALSVIRAAGEECAPPGAVANDEALGPEPMVEAEALVRGIYAIAARCR